MFEPAAFQPPQDVDEWKAKLMGKIIIDDEKEDKEEIVEQSENTVLKSTIPKPNRVQYENSPMTMDYRPNRLNVIYDESGTVVQVFYA
ncbi:hypothetical protein EC973_002037 [Apophysomyces ossiformis]|uniref:Uncharacterized protein n=1 Tax=Apophysomyces ossiformis TaxID=679940 RepID=A0A8H7BH98_9FUNG|nr:hypothetical protein EC973_002037 [Apophysomyces ossiformis]